MKIRLIVLVTALMLGVAAFGQTSGPKPEKFIDFEVVQPDGKTVRLSDYVGNGKYILVDFWASWCGPCREEIPRLKDLWYEFKGDRFDIVGAPVFDKAEKTLEAVAEFKIPWKQILNVPEKVPAAYGFDYIPYIILVGPDGTILARDLRGQAIRETVKKYLSEKIQIPRHKHEKKNFHKGYGAARSGGQYGWSAEGGRTAGTGQPALRLRSGTGNG